MSVSDSSAIERAFQPKESQARLAEQAGELVQLATKNGAGEAEVYGQHGHSVSVTFEKGDLKLAQVDDAASLGLRVFEEGRLGFSCSNQVESDDLARTAEDALSLARLNQPEKENHLASPRPLVNAPLEARGDLCELEVERIVELASNLASSVLAKDPRISLETATVSVHRLARSLRASNGVNHSESDAAISLSLMGMAIDGDDVGGFHYAGESLRDLERLDEVTEELVDDFSRILLGNLQAGAAKSYRGPILLSPEALLSICVSPLLSAASAIAVQRGRSALAGKLGETIASAALRLTDDPSDLGLSGASSFDREGQPTSRFPIVEDGVLKSYLYNGYAANVEERESTGHAQGSARSVPGLGVHSLHVDGGDGGSFDEMLSTLGEGLYVERFSGSVDPTSGDFSGVAKSARWIEGGREVRSVKETLLSGNAFELLLSDLTLGSESLLRRGSYRAPYALIDGVSVTAG